MTTSLSAGVSALASTFDWSERPRVVVTDFEFPTVGQIWHAQELRGAEVVHVQPDGVEIPIEHFDELIDERTALVSVTAVCYRNGARLPVEEVVELAHARGALVLLDAYQAIGTYPIDVGELGVDFLGAGVLKYLLASAGLGFLWCRPGLAASRLPTQTGWFADRNIFEMDIHDYSPSPTARRFESGTPPIPAIYAGIAGIELIQEIGIAETREHVTALNERLIAGVDELGGIASRPRATPSGAARSSASARPTRPRSSRALAADGIVTSERDGNLRVSAHAYNVEEDIDTVLAALAPPPRASRTALDGFPLEPAVLPREVGYARPSTLAEALDLLAANDGARALAGGQTLVSVMKARVASPEALVDLNGLDELQGVELAATAGSRSAR